METPEKTRAQLDQEYTQAAAQAGDCVFRCLLLLEKMKEIGKQADLLKKEEGKEEPK